MFICLKQYILFYIIYIVLYNIYCLLIIVLDFYSSDLPDLIYFNYFFNNCAFVVSNKQHEPCFRMQHPYL